ncbi:MAG TPA: D-alanine--D-alanine ligase [Anaeromyxobacteraceae bacterium]|nr:D-alanine--D-alanine ligase [Anaeromyxobacteraceae bacterium]
MGTWSGKKVAMLYGGRSSEREVSLLTGKSCAEALRARGYDVTLVDVDLEVAIRLREVHADVAFIALHGRWGEDGSIQGLLESMSVPYTGSGVLASALGMDKVFSKILFREHGLKVIEYRVFPPQMASRITVGELPFGLPAVVKPAGEGSSVGVHIVRDANALVEACRDASQYKGEIVVERYLKGTEVQVAVLDGKALGAIEIVHSREFYDYEAKYAPGGSRHFYPARVPDPHYRAVCAAAERAHAALGCSGVTRTDFILTADGSPFILEVNTLPGMTATSLVPEIAAGNGISFADLCERLLESATLKA